MAGDRHHANVRQLSKGTVAFFDKLEEYASGIAIIGERGERVSYAELAQQADRSAEALGPTRRLLLLGFRNTINCVTAYLGALRQGHPIILADPSSTERLHSLAATFGPDFIFDGSRNEWSKLECSEPIGGLNHDLALLLGTSGSSGGIKLVRLSHENIDSNARSIAKYLAIEGNDRAITSLPLFYSYGLSVLNSHLTVGAAVILTDKSVADREFWSLAAENDVTHLAGVPYTYELLERIRFRERAPPSLRILTQAGGKLPADLVRTYGDWARSRGIAFCVMYGQTEATARMAYVPASQLAGNEGAIGQPIPGGSIRLVDEAGRDVTLTAAEGQLVYTGPNVMLGYASKRADLALGREVWELATGDLATRDPSGFFRIVGRKSRFCKVFGVRVALDELEGMLRERGLDAIVAGSDDLIAVAVRSTEGPQKVPLLVEEALRLPPGVVYSLNCDEFPRLASGKVDYQSILRDAQALRESARAIRAAAEFKTLFEQVFPRALVDDNSSFESLGGDSLTYVNMSGEIEDRLGFIPDDWERLSLADLNALVKTGCTRRRRSSLLDTDILLRFAAIGIVVFDHARNALVTPGIFGGAELFLLLAGVTIWRFHLSAFGYDRFGTIVGSFCRRVILPYYVILLCYAVLWEWPGWSSILMVSTFEGRFKSILEPFWFLETLFHSYLLVWGLSKLGWLRILAAKRAFAFAGALVIFGFILQAVCSYLVDQAITGGRTLDRLFVLIALGCAAAAARSPVERTIVVAMAVALAFPLGSIGIASPYPMLAGVVMLISVNKISVPAWAKPLIIAVTDAGFAIFLVHQLPIWTMNRLGAGDYELVKMVLGILLGLVIHRAAGTMITMMNKKLRLPGFLSRHRPLRSSET